MKDSYLKLRISEEEYDKFQSVCEAKGKTMSEVLRSFVSSYSNSQNIILLDVDNETLKASGELCKEKQIKFNALIKFLLEKAIKTNAFEKTDRRNWKRPNKYFINYGIYLPGHIPYKENNGVGTLIIHIDSSGSINNKDLRKAGYIIYKSIQHFEKIIVLVADIEIHQTVEFRKNNRFGGKGTPSDKNIFYFRRDGIGGKV